MLKQSKVIQPQHNSVPATPSATNTTQSPPQGYTKKSGCGCGKRP